MTETSSTPGGISTPGPIPAPPSGGPGAGPGDAGAGQRILIIRLSAIGDVIHALPVLSALKRARPQAFVGWAVDDRAARLLEGHPLIDQLHILPVKIWKQERWSILRRWKALRQFGAELRAQNYTATLDIQGLSKSAYLGYLSGAPLRIGFGDQDGREISRWFNNRRVKPAADRRHVVDKNLALLEPLLGALPALTGNPRLDFPLVEHAADQNRITAFWQEHAWPVALRPWFLYPFTMWKSKIYPHDQLAEVGRLLVAHSRQPVIVGWGGPEEGKQAQAIVEAINAAPSTRAEIKAPAPPAPTALAVLAPPTTLSEQAALLDRCRLAVGPDTGPIHTAVARGLPCVTLYGASDEIRNGPYGPPHVALTAQVPCRPCWKQTCPLTDTPLICLTRISPLTVVNAAFKLAGMGLITAAAAERGGSSTLNRAIRPQSDPPAGSYENPRPI